MIIKKMLAKIEQLESRIFILEKQLESKKEETTESKVKKSINNDISLLLYECGLVEETEEEQV